MCTRYQIANIILLFCASTLLSSCLVSGTLIRNPIADGGSNSGPAELVALALSPGAPAVALGYTQQMVATGTYSDHSTKDLTHDVTWSQMNGTGSATINGSGLVATLGGTPGTITVGATLNSLTANEQLTITSAVLVSIAISPPDLPVVIGTSQKYSAIGTYSDNTTQDITNSVTWSYTNQSGAATINSSGLADTSGGAAGNVIISASLNSVGSQTNLPVASAYTTGSVGTFWPVIANGQAATSAQLYNPGSVTLDSAGNLYIADKTNNVIRRVDTATGIITNVAGTGNAGFAGDGAAATSALLNQPSSVAVDSHQDIYIADANNNRIRKVDGVTGIITTYAGTGVNSYSGDGGPATSASVQPSALALDSANNLYSAEPLNRVVRKINYLTGVITTVAGTGAFGSGGDGGAATSAQLSTPQGVVVDNSNGNIYIADTLNEVIRVVDGTTGIISLYAGNYSIGNGGDGGPATSAQFASPLNIALDSSSNLYVTDEFNNRVRMVQASTGIITNFAGNGNRGYSGDGGLALNATLSYPGGIAVDPTGIVYISDSANHAVRKIDLSADITTFAGHYNFGFGGDGGTATASQLYSPAAISFDSVGNLFIADTNNNRIRKVDATTGLVSTVAGVGGWGYNGDGIAATSAQLYNPTGVIVDAAENIYIMDTFNARVRRVDATTGIITTVAGNGNIGFGGDGGPATSANIFFPHSFAIDKSDNIYIADTINNRIRRVDATTGIITTIAGTGINSYNGDNIPASTADINNPLAITIDNNGNLFFCDNQNMRIRKIDIGTGIITTVAGGQGQGFSGDGGAATSAQINSANGIAVDNSGNIYIGDTNNQRIRRVNASTGVITTIAGNGNIFYSGDGGPSTNAVLNYPEGVAVDASGNLFVADSANNVIRKFSP